MSQQLCCKLKFMTIKTYDNNKIQKSISFKLNRSTIFWRFDIVWKIDKIACFKRKSVKIEIKKTMKIEYCKNIILFFRSRMICFQISICDKFQKNICHKFQERCERERKKIKRRKRENHRINRTIATNFEYLLDFVYSEEIFAF